MSPSTSAARPDGDYQTFDFNDNPIQLIPHDGDFWVTGEAVGGALGYSEPLKAVSNMYERNREEVSAYSCTLKLGVPGDHGITQRRMVRVYNEEGIMIITMLSRQPRAAEFRAWAVQILKAYRKGELVMNTPGVRDHLLELCIRESGKGNIAAMDILVTRYGMRHGIIDEQTGMLAMLHGRMRVTLPPQPVHPALSPHLGEDE